MTSNMRRSLAGLDHRRTAGPFQSYCQHEEIRARGWTGGILAAGRYLRQFRTADGRDRQTRAQPQLTAPSAPPPPRPRQVTRWIMTHPDHLAGDDAANLARLLDASPKLAAAAAHVRSFANMMTRRQGLLALEDWLTAVEAGDQPAFHSFARGIRRDQQAVTAGLARTAAAPSKARTARSSTSNGSCTDERTSTCYGRWPC